METDIPNYPPLQLAPHEVIKRTWLISRRHRAGWIDSCLTVTDCRVIYRARSAHPLGSSATSREVQVQDVNGASLVSHRGVTPLTIITIVTAVVLGLVLLYAFNVYATLEERIANYFSRTDDPVSGWTIFLGILLILLATGHVIARCLSREVTLAIYARGMETSPILLQAAGRADRGWLARVCLSLFYPVIAFLESAGMADATAAANQTSLTRTQAIYEEFGALILELQNSTEQEEAQLEGHDST